MLLDLNDRTIRPIRLFGFILMLIGVFGEIAAAIYYVRPKAPSFVHGDQTVFNIWTAVSLYYVLTGFGTALLRKWGYVLLIIFLYAVFLVIPVGTYISWKTLSYMKRQRIKLYFGFPE